MIRRVPTGQGKVIWVFLFVTSAPAGLLRVIPTHAQRTRMNGAPDRKSNRRSFDCVWRMSAPDFAQDDSSIAPLLH